MCKLLQSSCRSLTTARVNERSLAPVGLNSLTLLAIQTLQHNAFSHEVGAEVRGRRSRAGRWREIESEAEHARGDQDAVTAGAGGYQGNVIDAESQGRCYTFLSRIRGDGTQRKKNRLSR